jgi:signal transduction histidine kinase
MGLSICRSIVETHDGRLWVSPATPQGAVFRVRLPSAAESAS